MAEPIEKRTNKSIDLDPGAGNQSIVPDPDLSATTSVDAYDAVERIRTSRALEGAGLAVEGDAYDAVERIRATRALGDEAPSRLEIADGFTGTTSDALIERDLDVAGDASVSADVDDRPSHLQRIEKDLDTGEMSTDASGEAPSDY